MRRKNFAFDLCVKSKFYIKGYYLEAYAPKGDFTTPLLHHFGKSFDMTRFIVNMLFCAGSFF